MEKLRVSENGRYFVKADGTPFVWVADTTWTMPQRLKWDDAEYLMQVRKSQGFTVLQIVALDPERVKKIIGSLTEQLKKLEDMGRNPIVITSPIVRLYFKKLASDYFKDIIVISYNEVESNVELQSVGMVTA